MIPKVETIVLLQGIALLRMLAWSGIIVNMGTIMETPLKFTLSTGIKHNAAFY